MRSDLGDIIADIYHRIETVERRISNQTRYGVVTEVDAAKRVARVKLNEDEDGKPFLTGWLPWTTPACGSLKVNMPPSVGQQVAVRSESGDLTDAVIDMSLRSDANPLPDAKPGEAVFVSGKTTFKITPQGIESTGPTFKVNSKAIDFKKNEDTAPKPPGSFDGVPMS